MKEETVLPPVAVTPAAIRQLETVGGTVRVDLAATGCCGTTYPWTTDPPGRLPAVRVSGSGPLCQRPGGTGADRCPSRLRRRPPPAEVPGHRQPEQNDALSPQPVLRPTVAGPRPTRLPGHDLDALGPLTTPGAPSTRSRHAADHDGSGSIRDEKGGRQWKSVLMDPGISRNCIASST